MSNADTKLVSLNKIFADQRLFRIPDYQRGYAWQQRQVVDLWNDLICLRSGSDHFTGMISLREMKPEEVREKDRWLLAQEYQPGYVIDGQQRLTTCLILISEMIRRLREFHPGEEDKNIYVKYGNFEDDLKKIFDRFILQVNSTGLKKTFLFDYEDAHSDYLQKRIFTDAPETPEENYYTNNLRNAQTFFREQLAQYPENEVCGLFYTLTRKMKFLLFEFPSGYDEFTAFETMNNRGKSLSNLELLKNRLVYLSTLFDLEQTDSAALRDCINRSWKQVYAQLGKNNVLLSDDEYLKAHWIVYYTYSRKKSGECINFLLHRFSVKNIVGQSYLEIEDSSDAEPSDADDDKPDTDETAEVSADRRLEPAELKDYVESLAELAPYWYRTFFPFAASDNPLTEEERTLLDRLNHLEIGYFRPLVTAICHDKRCSPQDRVEAFAAIERFIFILFRMGRLRSNWGNSYYYQAAHRLFQKDCTVGDIIDALNKDIDSNREYCINNFLQFIKQQIEKGKGYYAWSARWYFLYEYEKHLCSVNRALETLSWDKFCHPGGDLRSIEHILPQEPTDEYWQTKFSACTDDEIRQLTGALGNLLPLAKSINSSLQNSPYPEKKAPYRANEQRGYASGSQSELEVANTYADWTPDSIWERSLTLLKFMNERWSCGMDDAMIEQITGISGIHDRLHPKNTDTEE